MYTILTKKSDTDKQQTYEVKAFKGSHILHYTSSSYTQYTVAYDDANELACDITRKYEAYYGGVDTFFKVENNKILDVEFHQDTDWNKILNSKEYTENWYVNYNYEFEPVIEHAQTMLDMLEAE